MKQFALAGISSEDRAVLARLVAQTSKTLDEAWIEHDGRAPIDLVFVDLDQFAGRVARVRAMAERMPLAVLADAGADTLDVPLVLRRPLAADAVAGVLARSGEAMITAPAAAVVEAPRAVRESASSPEAKSVESAAGPAARASFHAPRRARECTDFRALAERGALLVERAGLPRLVLDPAGDAFHANAPLSRLEPYFLDPVKGSECRALSRSRLEELRASAPGRPLVQLHWMGALLRSNGCLGAHLDPGGTFRVKRWMSVYGEYRKQYRIATQMLRPARLHEIARKAEAAMVDVFDVVNAYDAIGLLEWEPRQSRHAAAAKSRAPTPAPDRRRMLAAALLAR